MNFLFNSACLKALSQPKSLEVWIDQQLEELSLPASAKHFTSGYSLRCLYFIEQVQRHIAAVTRHAVLQDIEVSIEFCEKVGRSWQTVPPHWLIESVAIQSEKRYASILDTLQ